jgi:hypothetical protein
MRTRAAEAAENPLAMLRLAAGGLLLGATVVALMLALAGLGWKGVQLAGALWALYGLVVGGIALVDPSLEGLARALQSAGLMRAGGGYSAIETMVIQGRTATLRRAGILAGAMGDPAAAAQALLDLRDSSPLAAADDLRVGLALADLYERQLDDAGSAMRELRRLIDLHPGARSRRRLLARLTDLKQ